MVPDVMTTELNRSKTGLIAMAGSRHLKNGYATVAIDIVITYVKWKIGLGTVALSVSKGSSIRRKPVGAVSGMTTEVSEFTFLVGCH